MGRKTSILERLLGIVILLSIPVLIVVADYVMKLINTSVGADFMLFGFGLVLFTSMAAWSVILINPFGTIRKY